MTSDEVPGADAVDGIREAWARLQPEVDTTPIEIVYRVLRAARLVEWHSDQHLAAVGLTRPELDLLMLLRRSDGPLRPSRLAEHLLFTAPATTKRLTALENRGLLTRTVDPADRRGSLVALTGRGGQLVDRVFPSQVAHEAELLAVLPPERQRAVASVLRELLAAL